jgi:3-oxoacyl-[acyl-carrier protein] reductase
MPQQIALITGASRGIGRGIALALAQQNWAVIVNYASHAAAAQEVVAAIESTPGSRGKALAIQADISLAPDRQRLVAQTLAHFGRIDLLVNNAGVAPTPRADILDATEDSFDRLININLKAPYFLTQLVAQQMIRQQEDSPSQAPPAIITISSISAYAASVNRGDYCIAKAGLSMLTSLFAVRLAEYGINVYEIRPGIIETDMTDPSRTKYDQLIAQGLTPIKRWGQPEDVAKAVLAVAEGRLPFSTGQVINVDGGFHMKWL